MYKFHANGLEGTLKDELHVSVLACYTYCWLEGRGKFLYECTKISHKFKYISI